MTEHHDRSAASEQDYLEDNIATVAHHLGQPGAFLSVHYDGDAKLLVDPGEVLKEVSRRLSAPAQSAQVRNATIEECAKLLDEAAQDWNRIRDPGMANNARSYARKIRTLASQPSPAATVEPFDIMATIDPDHAESFERHNGSSAANGDALAELEQQFMRVLDGWEEDGSSPAAASALQYALGAVRDAMHRHRATEPAPSLAAEEDRPLTMSMFVSKEDYDAENSVRIVSRLRNFAVWNSRQSHYEPVPLCKEAADLIERIRAVPQPLSKMLTMLAIIDAAGGQTAADDSKWSWLNYFCSDEEPTDTFNKAIEAGFLHVTHDNRFDSSTALLTDMGRAALVLSRPKPSTDR